MKRTIITLLCGAALLAGLTTVDAMAAKKSAKAGKHEQRARIKEAVRNGRLTRAQAKELKGELKTFRAKVKAAKANGKISPEERARFKAERRELREKIGAQERPAN